MSVRRPDLRAMAVPDIAAAAERILAQPEYRVQRVSIDEIYTFALLTRQFVDVGALAARLVAGTIEPPERDALRHELVSLGFLHPQPQSEETHHV